MNNPALAFLFVFLFFLAPVLLAAGPFLFFYVVYVLSARRVDPVDAAPLSPNPRTAAAAAGSFQIGGYVRMVSNYVRKERTAAWSREPGVQAGGLVPSR
jgi:hypothetical protein